VQHLARRCPEDRDLVSFVEDIDPPNSVLVVVHRDDLWGVASRVMAMQTRIDQVFRLIHALSLPPPNSGMGAHSHCPEDAARTSGGSPAAVGLDGVQRSGGGGVRAVSHGPIARSVVQAL
jgi:hypothetical protein